MCVFLNAVGAIKSADKGEGTGLESRSRKEGRKEGRELTVASVIVLNEGRMKDGGCPIVYPVCVSLCVLVCVCAWVG